ncbi:MAG: UDP-N-acetylglucosamine 1-carboxyvinyltransferase [bacterium]
MRKIIVKGGRKLNGTINISGSKNSALAILAASILLPGHTIIRNVPNLLDVQTIIRVLRTLGLRAEYSASQPNTVEIWNKKVNHVAPYELVTKMRASFFVIGPILARKGMAKVPLPGGCAIGSRPVNLHIKGLEDLGAKVRFEHGFVIVEGRHLKGAKVYLDFPSVGATETVMMAASLADGETLIENAACEPEIVDLENFLNAAGAKISGAGTEKITIHGVKELHAVEHVVIPDRIEAGTYMIAAAMTKGSLTLNNIVPSHIESTVRKLQSAGLEVVVGEKQVTVSAINGINPIDLNTMPYPGFPTDMQPQMTALLSLAKGTSVIRETVFENRFMHVPELNRMGAEIKLEGQSAIVHGVNHLSSAPIKVSDLRAGAALVLAALAAEGETIIEDQEHHLERGYERLEEKLNNVGAEVSIV